MNPYESIESFILKKCDPNFPFRDNDNVYHGKKYEPIATKIYEHIYNNKVYEFGALPSEQYKFLGASPDGICSKYTLDNKFSSRLGTMLEIKCPASRPIFTRGKIIGTICPFHYYCQVQQQLLCCNLDVCDFWQCKLSEFDNKEDYLNFKLDTIVTQSEIINNMYGSTTIQEKLDVDDKLKKGLFLEFYPKKFKPEFEGDNIKWKSKYVMPDRLDMNENEYDNWSQQMLNDYKKLYPDIHKNYNFNKIIYWKLNSAHNVPIVRDDIFLQKIIPKLEETWKKIIYYRKNKDKFNELRIIADKRKEKVNINITYSICNDYIMKNNINFLDKKFDCNSFLIKFKKESKKN
jgi:putative phage-type endonuclease